MKLREKLKSIMALTIALSLVIPNMIIAAPAAANTSVKQMNVTGDSSPRQFKERELIFKLKKNSSDENRILKKYGLTVIHRDARMGYVLAAVRGEDSVDNVIKKLKIDDSVAYVQPNFVYSLLGAPNDPQYSRQWALKQVKADTSWNTVKAAKGTTGVTVAVLDSGVDVNHPDLKNRLVPGTNTVNPLKSVRDNDGHGTHVAGIIAAATNNSLGVAGVAGAAPVKIMPVKVFEGDTGSDISISDGIIWAADHGAKVINMSFGSYSKSFVLNDAIEYAYQKGVIMIAAAGNWASEEITYPAAISKVIAVSATDKNGKFADFSSFGPLIDLCAPGNEVYSTYWDSHKGSTYTEMSGTSMASPMVAGLAALLLIKNPALTGDEVRQIMEVSATDLGEAGWDPRFGHGEINVSKALSISLNKIDDANSTMNKAVSLENGQKYNEKIDFGSDQDWYKIHVPENGYLAIEVLPAGKVSPGVEVYDQSGKILTSFNTGGESQGVADEKPTDESAWEEYLGVPSFKVAEDIYGLVSGLNEGDYYIKVFGNHFRWSDQQYTLTASIITGDKITKDINEPNNSYKEARKVTVGTQINGAILATKDVDWFKVDLPGRVYKIHVKTPRGLDLAVDIESQVNYLDLSSGNTNTDYYQEWFSETVNSGGVGEDENKVIVLPQNHKAPFYIKVYDVGGGAYNQNYTLSINGFQLQKDQYEPNGTWNTAARLGPGQTITANFDRAKDDDWYVFDVAQQGVLTLNFRQPSNTWCDIQVYSNPESGPLIESFASWLGLQMESQLVPGNSKIYDYKVFPGKYYIRVSNQDKSLGSDYRLNVEFRGFNFIDHENNDLPSRALKIDAGTTYSGTIFPAADTDIYSLNVEKPQPFVVYLRSPEGINLSAVIMKQPDNGTNTSVGNSFGASEDTREGSGSGIAGEGQSEPELEFVTHFDTGGKGQIDTGVFVPSKPGKYYIMVLNMGGTSEGQYSFTVNPFKIQPDKWENNDSLKTANPVSTGVKINPTLMGTEDQDWYKVYLKQQGKLEVSLTVPNDIDGVCEIYDQSGVLIARADQSMVGEKEDVLVTIKRPGFYYIKVFDYLGNSSVQPYELFTRFSPVK